MRSMREATKQPSFRLARTQTNLCIDDHFRLHSVFHFLDGLRAMVVSVMGILNKKDGHNGRVIPSSKVASVAVFGRVKKPKASSLILSQDMDTYLKI